MTNIHTVKYELSTRTRIYGSEKQRKDSSRADGLPENPTTLETALIDADG